MKDHKRGFLWQEFVHLPFVNSRVEWLSGIATNFFFSFFMCLTVHKKSPIVCLLLNKELTNRFDRITQFTHSAGEQSKISHDLQPWIFQCKPYHLCSLIWGFRGSLTILTKIMYGLQPKWSFHNQALGTCLQRLSECRSQKGAYYSNCFIRTVIFLKLRKNDLSRAWVNVFDKFINTEKIPHSKFAIYVGLLKVPLCRKSHLFYRSHLKT